MGIIETLSQECIQTSTSNSLGHGHKALPPRMSLPKVCVIQEESIRGVFRAFSLTILYF